MNKNILVQYINAGNLKIDNKNRYYYMVPASERRNGRRLVSHKTINLLLRSGLITIDKLLK